MLRITDGFRRQNKAACVCLSYNFQKHCSASQTESNREVPLVTRGLKVCLHLCNTGSGCYLRPRHGYLQLLCASHSHCGSCKRTCLALVTLSEQSLYSKLAPLVKAVYRSILWFASPCQATSICEAVTASPNCPVYCCTSCHLQSCARTSNVLKGRSGASLTRLNSPA